MHTNYRESPCWRGAGLPGRPPGHAPISVRGLGHTRLSLVRVGAPLSMTGEHQADGRVTRLCVCVGGGGGGTGQSTRPCAPLSVRGRGLQAVRRATCLSGGGRAGAGPLAGPRGHAGGSGLRAMEPLLQSLCFWLLLRFLRKH